MNDILVIIVIYKKPIEDLFLVSEITKSGNDQIDILIYDNSPAPQKLSRNHIMNLYYVHDSTNSGVSRGYNTGIDKARELNKKYVLILDQDTEFSLGKLEEYIRLRAKHADNYIYAPLVVKENKIYSPFIEKHAIGKAQSLKLFDYTEKYHLHNKSLINSGLMIPLKIINKIGSFNEKIKLDFSDIYYVEKYKKLKSEIILVNVMLTHNLSGDEGKNFDKDIHRFKYYCNGARELSQSLSKGTFLSVTRRMIRLIQKYHTLQPIKIYLNYYLREFKI